MLNLSLQQLGDALAARKISSVELTQLYLDRIAQFNPELNAYITVDAEKSLAQARAADARIAAKNAEPLTGIPIAQKDSFCIKGWLTTCGSKMLHNFVSPYDAHIIEQFDAVGAVNLGKANMDEFAMGATNETSYYGPVKNPWNTAHVPGGSSGGSAAAVAAQLCAAATGTDTGGSIRQPAALCGISSLKPTYGICSRYGIVPFASSLDQAGPMGHSAADLALLLNVMAGFDKRDSTSLQRTKEDYTRDLDLPLTGLRIGLPKEFFTAELDSEIAQAVQAALEEYKKLGATLIEISLPHTHLFVPVYYILACAEASGNLSRFDGVRYGYRAPEYDDLNDMYKKTRTQGFGAEVKRRLLIGTYVLSEVGYKKYYLQAQKIRRLMAQDFMAAFTQCDVIMGPTTTYTAPKLGEPIADIKQAYLSDAYTISTNMAGLPSMSIPCGIANNHLPIGLHIIGNHFDEARMLSIAHQFQCATDWHQRTPSKIQG